MESKKIEVPYYISKQRELHNSNIKIFVEINLAHQRNELIDKTYIDQYNDNIAGILKLMKEQPSTEEED